jgi:hypothetical protein
MGGSIMVNVSGNEIITGCTPMSLMSWGSSVSMVSGYRLDDREIEVRSLAETKRFSL